MAAEPANWDERYAEKTDPGEASLVVKRAATLAPPGRALDLACGMGRNALYLARAGWQVDAVDASAAGIAKLARFAEEAGVVVNAIHVAAESFPIEPQAYDLALVAFYLDRALLRRMRPGVRPGGLAVAQIHLAGGPPDARPRNPAFLLAAGELRTLFEGWEVLHYAEREPEMPGHRRAAEIIARAPDYCGWAEQARTKPTMDSSDAPG